MKLFKILLLTAVLPTGHAQSNVRSKSVAKKIGYSPSAFSGTLTYPYTGNDLARIYEGLAKAYEPKGEFETTTHYEGRRQAADTADLPGAISRRALVSFVFPTPHHLKTMWAELDTVKSNYDADSGNMTVAVKVSPTYGEGLNRREENSLSIIWDKNEGTHYSSVQANAYGASAEVNSYISTHYGIAFNVGPVWGGKSTSYMGVMDYPITVIFNMTPEKAKALKQRLRVLLICQIGSDPILAGHYFKSASFSSPSESSESYKYLRVVPKELWVFDAATGIVLAKTTNVLP
jgi:hypothetical protein